MKPFLPAAALALALGACNAAEGPANGTEPLPKRTALPPPEADLVAPEGGAFAATDAWLGRWTGVEGLALYIAPGPAPGRYTLTVTLLDGTEVYEGSADGEVIRFTRNGETETIRAVSGAETGLKWLADEENCLMIDQGEGFCRD